MKIVIINPILYTNEKSNIKKVKSIKDSMIYNLCLEFKKSGHEPLLIAAKDYMPEIEEVYDFKIQFLDTKLKKIFKPNCLPYLKGLKKYLDSIEFDCIISSEVFSINSLIVSKYYKRKLIIWHELAKHNNIFNKIPSIFWYNVIVRLYFRNTRIVPRSENARLFISNYCNNVSSDYIDHGVNLNEFTFESNKENYFVVVSQLIKRKHIDGIIIAFNDFCKKNKNYELIIIGSGEEKNNLVTLSKKINIDKKVKFLGQKTHAEIVPILSKACALVINTEKDNSMLTIVESIACGTPIVTTDVPYNCDYIKKNNLGIITKKQVESSDLISVVNKNIEFVENCKQFRNKVSNSYHVNQFISEISKL